MKKSGLEAAGFSSTAGNNAEKRWHHPGGVGAGRNIHHVSSRGLSPRNLKGGFQRSGVFGKALEDGFGSRLRSRRTMLYC